MRIPKYEGEMQRNLEAALEHLSQVWGTLKRAGIDDVDRAGWPPDPNDYPRELNDPRYSLAAVTQYVYFTWASMAQQWGSTDGQLCPYDNCAYDLAIPKEGWYTCGHCLKDFYAELADGIEDYHCYREDERRNLPKPESVPLARVLDRSWASPKDEGSSDERASA